MKMYQHDRAKAFQFVLHGDLVGERVQELEHAWTTAKSILGGKELAGRCFWHHVCGQSGYGPPGSHAGFRGPPNSAAAARSEEFLPIFRTTGSSAKRRVHQDQSAAVLPHVLNKLIASVPGIPA